MISAQLWSVMLEECNTINILSSCRKHTFFCKMSWSKINPNKYNKQHPICDYNQGELCYLQMYVALSAITVITRYMAVMAGKLRHKKSEYAAGWRIYAVWGGKYQEAEGEAWALCQPVTQVWSISSISRQLKTLFVQLFGCSRATFTIYS